MARLRRNHNVTVLAFEEKTRVSNLFMLLVEIDARLPKAAKARATKSTTRKGKPKHKPMKKAPYSAKATKGKLCTIKCPAICCSSRTALRDLYLEQFIRILRCNQYNFIMGYWNDRHHSFIAYT